MTENRLIESKQLKCFDMKLIMKIQFMRCQSDMLKHADWILIT